MPAFLTHYLFGTQGFKQMEEGVLKKAVRRHKKAYALGLSGPDIFFYFVPDLLLGGNKPGTIMHEKACGIFLHHMLEETTYLTGEEKIIARAYLAGFIGHYELDSHCHPHVYQYIEQTLGNAAPANKKTGLHFCYECAMDYYFLKYGMGKTPSMMNQNKLVKLSKNERKTICRLVSRAYNRTYACPNLSCFSMEMVLVCLRFVMHFIRDKKGRKEKFWTALEKRILGYSLLGGLFVNDNCYGIKEQEWEKMNILFQAALKNYACTIKALNIYFKAEEQGEAEQINAAKKDFYKQLGNRSYHTGQTV